jgi:hypothetical protein
MPVVSHVEPNLAPAAGGNAYPSELARYLGSGTWHGYTIANFAVFPVRTEGTQVVFYDHINLHIATTIINETPGVRSERASAQTCRRSTTTWRARSSIPRKWTDTRRFA